MNAVGNIKHAVSIVGYWIFDSNDEFAILLTIYSFNCTYYTSVGKVIIDWFETVLYAVRYINNTGKLKIYD